MCIRDSGWPAVKSKAKSHGNRCCYWLKEKPATIYYRENKVDLVFTGLTSAESRNRWMFLKRCGPLYYAKSLGTWRCHPIHDWTPENVWTYIRSNQLAYNPLYDRGAKRCGCGPCTAYIDWKKQLYIENPKLLRIILQKQGQQPDLFFDCKGDLKK